MLVCTSFSERVSEIGRDTVLYLNIMPKSRDVLNQKSTKFHERLNLADLACGQKLNR